MKYGEADTLLKGCVLVCYMNNNTYMGKYVGRDSEDLLSVEDVVNESGIRNVIKNTFYIPRTNIADAKQTEMYLKFMQQTETEIGGNHYGKLKMQPIDYIEANDMDFDTGNVIKYISRHPYKNGAEDVQKAIDYCTRILAHKYNIKANITYDESI